MLPLTCAPSRFSFARVPHGPCWWRLCRRVWGPQGYGFLSENAAFVEACVEARIQFVGPSAHSIVLFGDKTAAKELVRSAASHRFSSAVPARC